MEAAALKIILDLQEKVTLYERATMDIFMALEKKNHYFLEYSLDNHIFTTIHTKIKELHDKIDSV